MSVAARADTSAPWVSSISSRRTRLRARDTRSRQPGVDAGVRVGCARGRRRRLSTLWLFCPARAAWAQGGRVHDRDISHAQRDAAAPWRPTSPHRPPRRNPVCAGHLTGRRRCADVPRQEPEPHRKAPQVRPPGTPDLQEDQRPPREQARGGRERRPAPCSRPCLIAAGEPDALHARAPRRLSS